MYSQYGEDEYISEQFFANLDSGVYLEIGAMDGVKYSNTLLFHQRGWRGVLVEANPELARQLCTTRPGDRCYNYAVACHRGTTEFSVADVDACGAVDSIIAPEMREKRHRSCAKIKVPCAPLSDIIDSSSCPHIDFWSLDVEGSELVCLETFDWNINVNIILIEMLALYSDMNDMCRMILRDHGFVKSEKDLFLSEIWINGKYLNEGAQGSHRLVAQSI